MAAQRSIGPLSQIPAGEGRTFDVGSRRVAVFHTRDGGVYATQARCPHRDGPLADGILGGAALVCPLHDWMFDLATGNTTNGACGIKTYAVSVKDGSIFIALDDGPETGTSADGPRSDGLRGDVGTGTPAPG